jgi:S-adenosylmethionine decarboxylase
MDYLGKQLVVELYGCDVERIDDINYVEKIMKEAAELAGAKVINSLFYKREEKLSGVVFITESYYGFRSAPALKYVGLDLFSYNETTDNVKALEFLVRKFGATKYSASEIKRGNKSEV